MLFESSQSRLSRHDAQTDSRIRRKQLMRNGSHTSPLWPPCRHCVLPPKGRALLRLWPLALGSPRRSPVCCHSSLSHSLSFVLLIPGLISFESKHAHTLSLSLSLSLSRSLSEPLCGTVYRSSSSRPCLQLSNCLAPLQVCYVRGCTPQWRKLWDTAGRHSGEHRHL